MTAPRVAASGRVVLFGATGFTGRLVAEALVRRELGPVLAGRNLGALQSLARGLEPLGEVSGVLAADSADPASVEALVGPGDVLVTTVGPFLKHGLPALRAAVGQGAHYIDSTGEPAFIRRVFEEYGPLAEVCGSVLLTAFGYDFVPGNLAAALALSDAVAAGHEPTAVEVGYYVRGLRGGGPGGGMSGGTRASSAGFLLESSHAWRGGRLRGERAAASVRSFEVGGRHRPAISIGGSEHLVLPRQWPALSDVGVYLGWSGPMSRPLQAATGVVAAVRAVPLLGAAVSHGVHAVAGRVAPGSTGGPSAEQRAPARTWAVAEVWAGGGSRGRGEPVARVEVEGPSPYDLTAELMAWAAGELAGGRVSGPGALGPAEAFGVEGIAGGCASVGLGRAAAQDAG